MEGFDISQLTQEQLDALMELGVLDEEQGMLDQQMQQALALGQPSGNRYTTPGGAVLGGLGDILGSGNSNLQQQKLRGQGKDLLGKKVKHRKTFAGLMGFGAQPAAPAQWADSPQPPESLAASSPFGFGGGSPYGYTPGGY